MHKVKTSNDEIINIDVNGAIKKSINIKKANMKIKSNPQTVIISPKMQLTAQLSPKAPTIPISPKTRN